MTNNKPKDKILNPIMKGISKKDFQNNNEKKRKEKTRQVPTYYESLFGVKLV